MVVKIDLKNKILANLADAKLLTKISKYLLKIFGQSKATISLSVFYVDSKEIQEVNKEYRKLDKPTDVISFRMIENENNLPLNKKNFPYEFDKSTKTLYLGEIFICDEIAKQQAQEFGNSEYRECIELYIHGLLHLLGCDHHEKEETERMKFFEEQMIKYLNDKKIL